MLLRRPKFTQLVPKLFVGVLNPTSNCVPTHMIEVGLAPCSLWRGLARNRHLLVVLKEHRLMSVQNSIDQRNMTQRSYISQSTTVSIQTACRQRLRPDNDSLRPAYARPLPVQPSPHPVRHSMPSSIRHWSGKHPHVWGRHSSHAAILGDTVRQMAKSLCIHPAWVMISTARPLRYKEPMYRTMFRRRSESHFASTTP